MLFCVWPERNVLSYRKELLFYLISEISCYILLRARRWHAGKSACTLINTLVILLAESSLMQLSIVPQFSLL